MKIYNTDVSYQSLGENLLIILRGNEKDIEETYNGFYNFGATADRPRRKDSWDEDSHLEYGTHNRDVATFMSSVSGMHRYFKNRVWHKDWENWRKSLKGKKGGITEQDEKDFDLTCKVKADDLLGEFVHSRETFYNPAAKDSSVHFYGLADSITAERPDDDFRDAILKDAFAVKAGKAEEKLDEDEVMV
jgi:hypothetical protein